MKLPAYETITVIAAGILLCICCTKAVQNTPETLRSNQLSPGNEKDDSQKTYEDVDNDPLLLRLVRIQLSTSDHLHNYLQGTFLRTNRTFLTPLRQHFSPIAVVATAAHGMNVYFRSPLSDEGQLLRVSRNGSQEVKIFRPGHTSIDALAIDEVTSNVYILENGRLKLCDSEFVSCSELPHPISLARPRITSMAFSQRKGLLFWFDSAICGTRTECGIVKSLRDGTQMGTIHQPMLDYFLVDLLTIDETVNRLYWFRRRKLYSSSFDGSNLQMITEEFQSDYDSFAVNGGHLFWGFRSGEIKSCNTSDTPCKPYVYENGYESYGSFLASVIIYTGKPKLTTDEERQMKNLCSEHICSHLCTYTLEPENRTTCFCETNGREVKLKHGFCEGVTLIAAYQNELYTIGLKNSYTRLQYTPIVHKTKLNGISSISAIAYDSIQGQVILAQSGREDIYSWKLGEKQPKLIVEGGPGTIHALEFDDVTNYIYWISTANGTLNYCKFGTQETSVLFKQNASIVPIDFTLASNKGYMFILFMTNTSINLGRSSISNPNDFELIHHFDHINATQLSIHYMRSKEILLIIDRLTNEIKYAEHHEMNSPIIRFKHLVDSTSIKSNILETTALDESVVWAEIDGSFGYVDMRTYEHLSYKIAFGIQNNGSQHLKIVGAVATSESTLCHGCRLDDGICSRSCSQGDMKSMDPPFYCQDGQKVALTKHNDGYRDCEDKTDEWSNDELLFYSVIFPRENGNGSVNGIRAVFIRSLESFIIVPEIQCHAPWNLLVADGPFIYFVCPERTGHIFKMFRNGSHIIDIHHPGKELQALAFDWYTANVYLIVDGKIVLCDRNFVFCQILQGAYRDKPSHLVTTSHSNANILWIEETKDKKSYIVTLNFDGKDARVTHKSTNGSIKFLTTDADDLRVSLYWFTDTINSISSSDVFQQNIQLVGRNLNNTNYSFAVKEGNIFWTDSMNNKIAKCEEQVSDENTPSVCHPVFLQPHFRQTKFGKNIIFNVETDKFFRDRLMKTFEEKCAKAICSHFCAYSSTNTITCLCDTSNRTTQLNNHFCRGVTLLATRGNEVHVIGLKETGYQYTYTPVISNISLGHISISAVAYDSNQGRIIVSESGKQRIYFWTPGQNETELLTDEGPGSITSMEFDHIGNNVYWISPSDNTLRRTSCTTKKTIILLQENTSSYPIDFSVVSSEGYLFVLSKTSSSVLLERFMVYEDGTYTKKLITTFAYANITGMPLSIHYSQERKILVITDHESNEMMYSDVTKDGILVQRLRDKRNNKVHSVTSLDDLVVWAEADGTINSMDLGPKSHVIRPIPFNLRNTENMVINVAGV